jgi:hypothetical protein
MHRNMHFLAKELEIEKQHRQKLQIEFREVQGKLMQQREDAFKETKHYMSVKNNRET